MRRLLVSVLLLSLTACDPFAGDETTVNVRLRTDRGTSGGVNTVIVVSASGEQTGGRTGGDGRARIRVAGPGEYQVRIVPRTTFHWNETLSKRVTVTGGSTAVAEFTLYHVGSSGRPPEPMGH